jgi:hypothetical protein
MAKIVEFAEVLTPEHTQYKEYAAGIKTTPPGVRLGDVLDTGGAKISLEHLRGIDPNTRIVYGHRVSWTPEESAAITAKYPVNLDPKNTI